MPRESSNPEKASTPKKMGSARQSASPVQDGVKIGQQLTRKNRR